MPKLDSTLETLTVSSPMRMLPPSRRNVAWAVLTSAWLFAVVVGLTPLWWYENTPGDAGQPPSRWPKDTSLQLGSDRAKLLLFAHPRCPCTRASMRELNLIVSRCSGKVDAEVLFCRSENALTDWETTDLWKSAELMRDVTARADGNGREAQLFNVTTSGHALLYGKDGFLLFSGGITPSRGHSGDNAGRLAIESLLRGDESVRQSSFVFGCSLCSLTDAER